MFEKLLKDIEKFIKMTVKTNNFMFLINMHKI